MKKIKMNCAATVEETFADFRTSRKAKGLADKTLQSYEQQFRAVARHLDVKTDIAMLQKAERQALAESRQLRQAPIRSGDYAGNSDGGRQHAVCSKDRHSALTSIVQQRTCHLLNMLCYSLRIPKDFSACSHLEISSKELF